MNFMSWQVYVAMFERSKEKYAEELSAYNIKKEQWQRSSTDTT